MCAFVHTHVGQQQHIGRGLIPALQLRMVFVVCVLGTWGSGWCLASQKATVTRRARHRVHKTGRTNVRCTVQDRRWWGTEEHRGVCVLDFSTGDKFAGARHDKEGET